MSVQPAIRLLLVSCVLAAFVAVSPAQDTPRRPDSPGSEIENFGLVPFQPIPTLMLTDKQRQAVRTLEDRQLQQRRALEDRYAVEMRALLVRQADERKALIKQLVGP